MKTFGDLSSAERIVLLKTMILSRVSEEKIEQLNNINALHGTNHMCIGQEASHVGLCAALNKNDWITATHRGHGFFLARGCSPYAFWAEMFGLKDGCCKGLGGSMHLADMDKHYMCSTGVVAAGVPISAGIALSIKYKHQSNIAVSVFGDGASNQGMTFETMNLAVVLKLPMLFYCENNEYAVSSSSQKFVGAQSIAKRAQAFGLKSVSVDGNDIESVFNAVSEAADYIRNNTKPYFIEVKTYRLSGHSRSDKKCYRDINEEMLQRSSCPITRYSQKLIEQDIITKEKLNEMFENERQETLKNAEICINKSKDKSNFTSVQTALGYVLPFSGGIQ